MYDPYSTTRGLLTHETIPDTTPRRQILPVPAPPPMHAAPPTRETRGGANRQEQASQEAYL